MATLPKPQDHVFRKQRPLHGAYNSPFLGTTFLLPGKACEVGCTEARTLYIASLQTETDGHILEEKIAVTFSDLIIIRAVNGPFLQQHPNILGTALGLRVRGGLLTHEVAILAFVPKKLQRGWVEPALLLPGRLWAPAGLCCALDVVQFDATAPMMKLQEPCALTKQLQGGHRMLGPGSQIASSECFGTLGVLAECQQSGLLGFVTSRHVAVNSNEPLQNMYHPLRPGLGPSVLLGTTDRAVSFATDHLWYGQFCSQSSGPYDNHALLTFASRSYLLPPFVVPLLGKAVFDPLCNSIEMMESPPA
jgi:hypothetical protein